MAPPGMSGHRWRQLVTSLRKPGAVCALCGHEIDITLKWPHKYSFTVEHVVPRSRGGDVVDARNAAPAHLTCNSSRGNRATRQRPRTSRIW